MIEESRTLTASNEIYKLEEGHTAEHPRLHRITNPQDGDARFWDFFRSSLMADLAADLVGPDVKFHHAKLNVKSEKGSAGFAWHQDIPAWPHTDFSAITIGTYLRDCSPESGGLKILAGSHHGPIYPMFDEDNQRVPIPAGVLANYGEPRVTAGKAGSVVVLNCRVIHGSGVNVTSLPRPLLLPVYTSADSFPYANQSLGNAKAGEIVRGKAARYACMDPRPCPVPPDYQKIGYSGPFSQATRNIASAMGM
jgi:ectoine hydroxylase-related dioxygenase (phytanoyl-CoA dioxygenase family)